MLANEFKDTFQQDFGTFCGVVEDFNDANAIYSLLDVEDQEGNLLVTFYRLGYMDIQYSVRDVKRDDFQWVLATTRGLLLLRHLSDEDKAIAEESE